MREMDMQNQRPVHPGIFWYFVGGMITAGGIGASIVLIIITAINALNGGKDFVVPGSTTINIEDVGSYTLWNKANTVYDGRSYRTGKELPDGMTITVTGPSGREIPVESAIGTSMESPSSKSYSVATFEAQEPGEYTVSVSNLDTQRVFMVKRSMFAMIMRNILISTAVGLIGLFVGLGIIIAVVVMRNKNKNRMRGWE